MREIPLSGTPRMYGVVEPNAPFVVYDTSGPYTDPQALTQAWQNALVNSAVLAAVKKASPFSPPPDHLRDTLQKGGIVLEFSP